MKITSKTDIEAPLVVVFAALSDFEAWERAAMRRGADVSRTDKMRTPAPGLTWALRFGYRGKDRQFDLKLITLDPAGKLGFSGAGRTLEGGMILDLVGLAPNRTRLVLGVETRALTLGARLLLQTLKLRRATVENKLNQRLVQLARDIEMRHASTTPRKDVR